MEQVEFCWYPSITLYMKSSMFALGLRKEDWPEAAVSG